jgi:hypothetical protein
MNYKFISVLLGIGGVVVINPFSTSKALAINLANKNLFALPATAVYRANKYCKIIPSKNLTQSQSSKQISNFNEEMPRSKLPESYSNSSEASLDDVYFTYAWCQHQVNEKRLKDLSPQQQKKISSYREAFYSYREMAHYETSASFMGSSSALGHIHGRSIVDITELEKRIINAYKQGKKNSRSEKKVVMVDLNRLRSSLLKFNPTQETKDNSINVKCKQRTGQIINAKFIVVSSSGNNQRINAYTGTLKSFYLLRKLINEDSSDVTAFIVNLMKETSWLYQQDRYLIDRNCKS